MKITVSLIISIILLFSACGGNNTTTKNKTDNTPRDVEAELMRTAEKYNAQAPFMINETTRFDSMSILPERIMQYNVTMTNLTKEETVIEYFEEQIPVLAEQIKSSIPPNLANDNVTFAYSYSDKNGMFVHKISITPNMYK